MVRTVQLLHKLFSAMQLHKFHICTITQSIHNCIQTSHINYTGESIQACTHLLENTRSCLYFQYNQSMLTKMYTTFTCLVFYTFHTVECCPVGVCPVGCCPGFMQISVPLNLGIYIVSIIQLCRYCRCCRQVGRSQGARSQVSSSSTPNSPYLG